MTLEVSYMGTKRKIAPLVADLVAEAREGPFLDLFAGICTVGAAIGPPRPIWCNDAQLFAASVARAFFQSRSFPPTFEAAATLAYGHYATNKAVLEDRFLHELKLEATALEGANLETISQLPSLFATTATRREVEAERRSLALKPQTFPYRLFSITYAGGYIGLKQSVEIDSIRFAIDQLHTSSSIDIDVKRWMSLGLCQALCKLSTTTGHFAQFLRVKASNKDRFITKRRRSVWFEWLRALHSCAPIGSTNWRHGNKVFHRDALSLLSELHLQRDRPIVVYADPPYTKDQYSRYYHLYETLLLYDYPMAYGIGRYRPDRFLSRFSLPSQAFSAITELIEACARLGSTLILTYPEAGLLRDSANQITSALRKHFRAARIVRSLSVLHSSMGASKGKERRPAKELVYLAY